MRRTWQIAGRELLQNRRDGLAALFTIVLPVIFTIFLGLIFGGMNTSTLPLAIVDSDQSATSQQLVQRLEASSILSVTESDLEDIERAVKDQKVAAGLIVPQGFEAGLESTVDPERPALTLILLETSTGAQTVLQAVSSVVSRFNASLLATDVAVEQLADQASAPPHGELRAQAASIVEDRLDTPAAVVTVVDGGPALAATTAQGFDQSSTGGLVNWVLFGIMGVAGMTVWERRQGLLRRLNVAGVKAPQIVGGKMIAMVGITMLQQLLLVLVGRLALGVDYFSSPLALLMVMLSLSGLAASFGLLISVLFRSEQAVIATTVISAQMLAALGGAWFPLEITGAGFSRFAHFLPSAWIMDSLHGITLEGWGAGDVIIPLAIVWAWIVGLSGLAVWRYRPE